MAIAQINPNIFDPVTILCEEGMWVDQLNQNLASVSTLFGVLNNFGVQLEVERIAFISDKNQALSDIADIKGLAVIAKEAAEAAANEAETAQQAAEDAAGTAASEAAQEAADTVIAAALGAEVNLAAGGSYTFPSSMTTGQKISINPTGDLAEDPATINYNGHKFRGVTITSDSYDLNVGVQFVYINPTYGLGAN